MFLFHKLSIFAKLNTTMNYIEYKFVVYPPIPWTEILIAHLSQIEFESFEETQEGVNAYITSDYDDEDYVNQVIGEIDLAEISYEKTQIKTINWNQEWEKNFHPVNVNNKCYIRAEFHEPKDSIEYEIIIQPKMSFGTGHHETTHLMVEYILEKDFCNKSVLDMGTGTGVLAILAKMRGAGKTLGIDIDEWSYQNAMENAEKNHVKIDFIKGGAESIPEETFDFIIANINRNILMQDMSFYIHALKENGTLLLSGLLDIDEEKMINFVKKFGLKFASKKFRNDWIALEFIK